MQSKIKAVGAAGIAFLASMSMIGATVAFADEASGTDATTPTTNDITISAPGG